MLLVRFLKREENGKTSVCLGLSSSDVEVLSPVSPKHVQVGLDSVHNKAGFQSLM